LGRIGKEKSENVLRNKKTQVLRERGENQEQGRRAKRRGFSVEFLILLNSGKGEASFQLIVYI